MVYKTHNMSIKFRPEFHQYESIDDDKINWLSVTSIVSNFKEAFDAKQMSEKVSKNKRSKWYGLTPEEIRDAWNNEAKRSTDLGSWYHDQREKDLVSFKTIDVEGSSLKIVAPIYMADGSKIAPDQKLEEGIYPELMVYLKSAGICGQSDLVEIINGKVNITDYKTNKEIKKEGFKNWEGVVKKMLFPLNHLDDCNLNHYTIQLSLYMYIILKHNPKLKPGKLTLHHILFEEQDRDKYDNPIYKIDSSGNFIVKEVVRYELPYLKSECISLINWLKDNRDKIKSKK